MEEVLSATLTEDKLVRICGTRELETVTRLELCVDMNAMGVECLSSLLPCLENLVLDGSVMSSFRDLGTGLSRLRTLSLVGANVKDLDGIGALRGLRELRLSRNSVEDLTPLACHEALQVLDLSHNSLRALGDLAVLGSCPLLYSLDLRGNPLALALQSYLPGLEGRTLVFQTVPQLRDLNGAGATSEELHGISESDMRHARDLLRAAEHDYANGSHRESTSGDGATFLGQVEESTPLPGYDSELTAGPVALTGNPTAALRRRRREDGRLRVDSLPQLSVVDIFDKIDDATVQRWRLEIEPEQDEVAERLSLSPLPSSPTPLERSFNSVTLSPTAPPLPPRPKSAVPRPVMAPHPTLSIRSTVANRQCSDSEDSDSEDDSPSNTRAAMKQRAQDAVRLRAASVRPVPPPEREVAQEEATYYSKSRRRTTRIMDVEQSLLAVDCFASNATEDEDTHFFHREDVEAKVPVVTTAAAVAAAAEPRRNDFTAYQCATQMDDHELIRMLRQPPREVPQLRTRELFQSFFSKMHPSRLDHLLQDAFAHAEPEEAERKISRRKSIMAGHLPKPSPNDSAALTAPACS